MEDEQKVSVMDESVTEESVTEESVTEEGMVKGETGAEEGTGEEGTGTELDLDDGGNDDLEGAMRDAVAAVEQVQDRRERPAVEEAPEEVEELRREVAELRDRSVRTLAELDNFRKRAERERRDIRRYALVEPMRDFLDVVDNLERAMAASGSFEDLKTGVEMILHQMRDLLRQHGVEMVEAEGRAFDPNVHEAVARVEEPEVDIPHVIQELQRGYKLHDRLLRPARVRVAVPTESRRDDGAEEVDEDTAGNADEASGDDS